MKENTTVLSALAPDLAKRNEQPSVLFLLLLGGYFILHIVLRVTISPALDFDEAEQVVLSQWLLPGYTEQPPLYTWVQAFFFRLFGLNTFAASLMKNGLLFLTYLFVYLAALRILQHRRSALLATISLFFIPQIGWESQRDMTHTVLVVCAAAATLWQLMRALHKRSGINYLLLGFCLSVGFLGKSNYLLFLFITVLTLLSQKEGRQFLYDRRILLTLVVPPLLCGEYFWWMYNNQDIVFSATHKFKRAVDSQGDYLLPGILSMVRAIIFFLFPCWLIYLLCFPSGFWKKSAEETYTRQFAIRYILFFLIVLTVVVLLFKVTYVKDRWLQPMLFWAPICFFARLAPEKIIDKRFWQMLIFTGIAVITIYTAFTMRIVCASWFNTFSRMNYPVTAMAEEIRKQGFTEGLIITNKRFLAGNMRLLFPESTAIIPGYHFERQPLKKEYQQVLIVWMPEESRTIPPQLSEFITKNYKINMADLVIKKIKRSYTFTPKDKKENQSVTLGVALAYMDGKKRTAPDLQNKNTNL